MIFRPSQGEGRSNRRGGRVEDSPTPRPLRSQPKQQPARSHLHGAGRATNQHEGYVMSTATRLAAKSLAGVAILVGSAVGTVVILIQHDRRRVARQRAQQVAR